jgi:hypothetical protein
LLALLALAPLAGCASERSYAHVTVRAEEGEFTDVGQLIVYVSNGACPQQPGGLPCNRDTLYYPQATPYKLSKTETVDFSVSLKTSYTGLLTVGVEPRTTGGRPLGYGEASKTIDPGHVIRLDVAVVRNALPPEPAGDGGVAPAGDGGGASACDPTLATSCGAGRTCSVGCRQSTGAALCTAAGAGNPGDTCRDDADCAPGSQCFPFPCGRVCMKFCKADTDCGEGRCRTDVPCGGQPTGFKVCSKACDPRPGGTQSCGGGLTCLIFPGEIASCDCGGNRRTGGDGAACTDARDCQPGLMCVGMGSASLVCRPICRLDLMDCAAGRTCTKVTSPDYKIWGACLP